MGKTGPWVVVTFWLGIVSVAIAHLLQAHGGDYAVQNFWFPWLESGESGLTLGLIQDIPGSVAIAALGLSALLFVYQRGLLQPWPQSLLLGTFLGVAGAVASAMAQGVPIFFVGLTAATAGVLILTYGENSVRVSTALALPLLCWGLLWAAQDVGGPAVLRTWNPSGEVLHLTVGTVLMLVGGVFLGLRIYPFPTLWSEKAPTDRPREFFSQMVWGTAVVFLGLRLSPWLAPEFVLPLRVFGTFVLSLTTLVGLLSFQGDQQIRTLLSVVLGGGFLLALTGARMEGLSTVLAGSAAVLALSWSGTSRTLWVLLVLCLIGIVPTPVALGWTALTDSSAGWAGALVWGAFDVLWGMLLGSLFSGLWKTPTDARERKFSPAPWLLAILASGFPWVERSPFQTTYARHVDPNIDAFTVLLVHHFAVFVGFAIFGFFVTNRSAAVTQSRLWRGFSGTERVFFHVGQVWTKWDQQLWVRPLAVVLEVFWNALARCGAVLRKLERSSHQAWLQIKQPVIAYSGRALERAHGGSLRWHLSLALTGGFLLFVLILREMWK